MRAPAQHPQTAVGNTVQPELSVAPQKFALLLLDSFSAFDLTAIVECLKEANRYAESSKYQWQFLSEDGQPVTASNGMSISVDAALVALDRRDILVVLGGDAFVSSSTLPILAWIRRQSRLGLTIGAISGAVFTMIKAGVLPETEVTTHWSYHTSMQENFQDLEINRSIFQFDNKRFTCAGGVATLDLMLQLISRDQGGEVATWVADNLVCSVPRVASQQQIVSHSTRSGERRGKIAEAVAIMQSAIETPVSPGDVAQRIGISTRQLERLFAKHLGATPKAYYMKLRLENARRLLLQTDMKVLDVAIASGFYTPSHFARLYKKHFGTSPHKESGLGSG